MRVLNDPVQEDSIWMNGPPTWTYLQVRDMCCQPC